jgi:Flp pilus assembly protein TadG
MMEFAVVATLFAMLMAGIVEFGRVWSAANVLNAAVRDGARLAAVTDKSGRNSVVKSRVQSTASTYFAGSDLNVQVKGGNGAGGEPLVTVGATGTLNMLFGDWLLGKKVKLYRESTMRDETVGGP